MSKLFVVPTPIGNLDDITLRALNVLRSVSLIVAEDTRTSSFLLKHFEIGTHMIPFHKFNEHEKVKTIVDKIKSGMQVAIISDAGTPGISDPGFLLVRECIKSKIEVETLPGATAFVPALINSGFATDRFIFEGFLPQKKGRKSRLEKLKGENKTIIFYESPYRVVKLLEELRIVFGDNRGISLSREISKFHEETKRGSVLELIEYFKLKEPKGEFVVVVKGEED